MEYSNLLANNNPLKMALPESQEDILAVLNLGKGVDQLPELGTPIIHYVTLAEHKYTRDAVEAAIKELPDEQFSDLANSTIQVMSFTWPPELGHHSSGGQVAFGQWIVIEADPRRYRLLVNS